MLLGVKRAIALAITQATGLPQCDRSSDRNDQHRDTLQHHPRTPHTHVTRSEQGPACIC